MNSDNPKNIWRIIKQKIGKNNNASNSIDQIYDEKRTHKVNNHTDIANHFNEYFSSVGRKLSEQISQPNNLSVKLPKVNPKSIFISPTNYSEFADIIQNMKPKNGGVDNISSKVIKVLTEFIIDPLVHIINLSIEKSIWPTALKNADIIPIHKSGNKKYISNYRPISLISNLAKIFEKIIYNRFLNFINTCNIISENQFGFVKGKGAKDALAEITKNIYEKMDKSIPIAITFLDLAKAFDTVDHKILLDKLYNYGIRGIAHKLITSYLVNRNQRVKINDFLSKTETITTGVPQGTILGPLLFILYVNDLLLDMPSDSILSYADDTAIIATDRSWTSVEMKMNENLGLVSTWLVLNKLSLNIDKTVVMTIGNYYNSVPRDFNIQIDSKAIMRVESTKYLGVIFDYNMNWKNHIEYVINKTKYLIFIFRKIQRFMKTKTLRMIYYAFFHSVISYGIIAWGGAYSNAICLLQNLQNKILKVINKNRFLQDNPLNIRQMFANESLVYHYNTLKNNYVISESNTRNKSIQLPRSFKTISNKNSYIKAIGVYNNLPQNLKVLNTKNYKYKLREWIKANM